MNERRLRIAGRSPDLARLAEMFNHGSVRVVASDGEYFIEAESFSGFGKDHVGVLSYGEDLLAQLDGVARLESQQHHESRLDLTIHDPDGSQSVVVRAEAASVTVSAASATLTGGTPASGVPGPAPAVRRFEQGQRDKAIKTVLELLASADWDTWVNLYRVLDWVASTSGGKSGIVNSGWMTKDELDRFGASANRHEVTGNQARHGPQGGAPPKRTMKDGEARSLIRRVVRDWIDSAADT